MHPKKLSSALWNYSKQSVGSNLVIGKVIEAILDSDGAVCGVKLQDGTIIEADALVLACGPWTHSARTWFGPEVEAKMPQMFGVKVGSYIFSFYS